MFILVTFKVSNAYSNLFLVNIYLFSIMHENSLNICQIMQLLLATYFCSILSRSLQLMPNSD